MSSKMIKQSPRINIQPEHADGVYSNVFFIASSQSEFVLDFARLTPGVKVANLKSRVIISPHRVKGLINALSKQMEVYEEQFGEIDIKNQTSFGFQNPGRDNIEE